jgi:hypothetical protein
MIFDYFKYTSAFQRIYSKSLIIILIILYLLNIIIPECVLAIAENFDICTNQNNINNAPQCSCLKNPYYIIEPYINTIVYLDNLVIRSNLLIHWIYYLCNLAACSLIVLLFWLIGRCKPDPVFTNLNNVKDVRNHVWTIHLALFLLNIFMSLFFINPSFISSAPEYLTMVSNYERVTNGTFGRVYSTSYLLNNGKKEDMENYYLSIYYDNYHQTHLSEDYILNNCIPILPLINKNSDYVLPILGNENGIICYLEDIKFNPTCENKILGEKIFVGYNTSSLIILLSLNVTYLALSIITYICDLSRNDSIMVDHRI